jgi:hypothetical protein
MNEPPDQVRFGAHLSLRKSFIFNPERGGIQPMDFVKDRLISSQKARPPAPQKQATGSQPRRRTLPVSDLPIPCSRMLDPQVFVLGISD